MFYLAQSRARESHEDDCCISGYLRFHNSYSLISINFRHVHKPDIRTENLLRKPDLKF